MSRSKAKLSSSLPPSSTTSLQVRSANLSAVTSKPQRESSASCAVSRYRSKTRVDELTILRTTINDVRHGNRRVLRHNSCVTRVRSTVAVDPAALKEGEERPNRRQKLLSR